MLKRKQKQEEIEGTSYIIKEPTGSQLQMILETQEKGEQMKAAYLCLKCSLFDISGCPVFPDETSVDDMMNGDISASIAMAVTQIAMGMIAPKKA